MPQINVRISNTTHAWLTETFWKLCRVEAATERE